MPAMSSRLPLGFSHVAHDDAVFGPEPRERLGVAHVVALEVVDRDAQHVARPSARLVSTERVLSTRSSTVSHTNLRPGVLLQRAGQQPGLGEHLEAVADADDRPAGGRELGAPRPSPARTGRSRRCAGSRRARTRRARPPRRRRARCASPCQSSSASPPSCLDRPHARRARSWCPGTRTTPTFARSCGTELVDLDGVALDHRVGEQPLAHLVDLRARGVGSESASSTRRMVLRDRHLRRRSCSRAPGARAPRWRPAGRGPRARG